MADPQKKNSSVNVKEKDPLQDLELGNDFFSWKSISIADGDAMDFDLTPASKGNKKTFNFDKADMDFNLDADFGKMSSFNLDMSDLDISPPLKKDPKPKEKSHEPSSGKDKGKDDDFGFGFDFDDLNNFNFDSPSIKESTKAQKDKTNKESSLNGIDCQNKEGSVRLNETGSKSTLEDGPQKPSLPESRITFDMDLEPMSEISPPNFAMDDGFTPEHSAATDEEASDIVKNPLQTTVSSEIPNISPSKRLVQPGQVDLEVCTKNGIILDLSSDYLPNHEPSGGSSSAMEQKVDSLDTNASNSNAEQDSTMTSFDDPTCNYNHTESRDSQHHQAVVVLENIDEASGVKSSAVEAVEGKVSSTDTDVSCLNGEDANMILVAGSTCGNESTSNPAIQAVAISENNSGERTQDGIKNHVEDDRERTEIGQTISLVEPSCITSAVSGLPCDTQSSRENQEPSLEILKSSIISQPADRLDKQIENIRESVVECSGPLTQPEKPERSVPKTSIQTNFPSLSSKQMGFAQPSLAKGRDTTQSVGKLSLQCSKTLLRGIIPQIQSQTSNSGLKISGDTPAADGLRNKLNDSGTKQVIDMVGTKSAPRQGEVFAKDLDTLSVETNGKKAEYGGNSKKLASILLNINTSTKEYRTSANEGGRIPSDLPGLKLSRLSSDSTKSPILSESKTVGNSSQESAIVSKSPSGIAHLPDKCAQTSSIDSAKSPISRESKLLGTSSQKSVLSGKTPPGTAHNPEKCKNTTSTLPMKRTLEDGAADTSALHPAKRLLQSVATSRNFAQTSEKVLDKKAPIHNHKEDDCIKSMTRNCKITPFEIPRELMTKGVEILSLAKHDSNIKLADACSKGLDDLCDNLRRMHVEAKELLVQSIVNSNKLLMLNNPQFEEKIRATQNLLAGLKLNVIQG